MTQRPAGLDEWLAENGYIIVDVARLDEDIIEYTRLGDLVDGDKAIRAYAGSMMLEMVKSGKYSPQEPVVDEKCPECEDDDNEYGTVPGYVVTGDDGETITWSRCQKCNSYGNKDSKGGEV